ncbi:MAG TPA: phosphoribosylglycinamide formyltransferase [bacterium]
MIKKSKNPPGGKNTRLGVLVSGNGSNLQAILDACTNKEIPAEVVVVISNKPEAFALERAKKAGVTGLVIEHNRFSNREDYDLELVKVLKNYNVDLVVLAGFMRVVTPVLLREFPMRVINIHPALLPSFPGVHVQRKALEYGVKFSGCTVHFVTEEVDAGPIIAQVVVPVHGNDTEQTLTERIHKEEHKIYPYAIKLYSEGKLRVEGRRVRITDCMEPDGPNLHNPVVRFANNDEKTRK